MQGDQRAHLGGPGRSCELRNPIRRRALKVGRSLPGALRPTDPAGGRDGATHVPQSGSNLASRVPSLQRPRRCRGRQFVRGLLGLVPGRSPMRTARVGKRLGHTNCLSEQPVRAVRQAPFASCLLRLRQRVAQLFLMRQEATIVRFLAEVIALVVMLGLSAFLLMHWLADQSHRSSPRPPKPIGRPS